MEGVLRAGLLGRVHIDLLLICFGAYLPGRIKTAVKHPMLAAVTLWALAHLRANGSLADVLLFGGFFAWAVADRISLAHRAAPSAPSAAPPGPRNDAIAIVLGIAVYALVVGWAHARLFGISPLAHMMMPAMSH